MVCIQISSIYFFVIYWFTNDLSWIVIALNNALQVEYIMFLSGDCFVPRNNGFVISSLRGTKQSQA